jgi:hypothetical protein
MPGSSPAPRTRLRWDSSRGGGGSRLSHLRVLAAKRSRSRPPGHRRPFAQALGGAEAGEFAGCRAVSVVEVSGVKRPDWLAHRARQRAPSALSALAWPAIRGDPPHSGRASPPRALVPYTRACNSDGSRSERRTSRSRTGHSARSPIPPARVAKPNNRGIAAAPLDSIRHETRYRGTNAIAANSPRETAKAAQTTWTIARPPAAAQWGAKHPHRPEGRAIAGQSRCKRAVPNRGPPSATDVSSNVSAGDSLSSRASHLLAARS